MKVFKRCIHCQMAFSPTSEHVRECDYCRRDGPFYTHIEMQLEAPQPELPHTQKERPHGRD